MKNILSTNGCGIAIDDFERYAVLLKETGIDGMDLPAGLIPDIKTAESIGKMFENLGLKWGLMIPQDEILLEDITDEDFSKALDRLERDAEIAIAAGCTGAFQVLWSGSNEMEKEEKTDWVCSRLSKAWDRLKPLGMKYGVEPLGPITLQNTYKYPFIRTASGAFGLLDLIDSKLGVVFDTFHWYCAGQKYEDLLLAMSKKDRILVVHINDALPGGMDEQMDLRRALPMENGIIDIPYVLRNMKKTGFEGNVTIESLDPWRSRFAAMETKKVMETISECYNSMVNKI